MMNRANFLDWVAYVLLVIGGLNWGLIGLFDFNLVAELFGADSLITNAIYDLVGFAAIYCLVAIPMMISMSRNNTPYTNQSHNHIGK